MFVFIFFCFFDSKKKKEELLFFFFLGSKEAPCFILICTYFDKIKGFLSIMSMSKKVAHVLLKFYFSVDCSPIKLCQMTQRTYLRRWPWNSEKWYRNSRLFARRTDPMLSTFVPSIAQDLGCRIKIVIVRKS